MPDNGIDFIYQKNRAHLVAITFKIIDLHYPKHCRVQAKLKNSNGNYTTTIAI